MATAAAATTTMRMVPRGVYAFLVVGCAFVLGTTWYANVVRIDAAIDRCFAIAAEVPVWSDSQCRESIKYAGSVAVCSAILLGVLLFWEAKAKVEADAHSGEVLESLAPGVERARLRKLDAMVKDTMRFLFFICVVFILYGRLIRWIGGRVLVDYPGDVGAAALMRSGSVTNNVGHLVLAVEFNCLIIPYAVLRLCKSLREKFGGAVPMSFPSIPSEDLS